jgi:predicted nucleic acid-binding protein
MMSAQSLNEFSCVAPRRGIPISKVRTKVEMLHDLGQLLPLTDVMTLAAFEVVERHMLSFWDALIWAVAKKADLMVVISEDFQHGRVLDGVTFVVPFRQG